MVSARAPYPAAAQDRALLLRQDFKPLSDAELRRKLLESVLAPIKDNPRRETDFVVKFNSDGSMRKTEMQIVPVVRIGSWNLSHNLLCMRDEGTEICRLARISPDGKILSLTYSTSSGMRAVDFYEIIPSSE